VIAAILAAEAAFWLVLVSGLLLRYVARAPRASTLVLASLPLVDLVLLALVAIDVAGGGEPTRAHAFAAMYLGFTVAFGRSVIAWADGWFRHRFAGGPRPAKPAKGSTAEVRAIWREWSRVVLGAAIAALCLLGMIALEGWHLPDWDDPTAIHPYWAAIHMLAIVVVVWFLAGPAFAGSGARDLERGAVAGRATSTPER
jgi:hypothetical protein